MQGRSEKYKWFTCDEEVDGRSKERASKGRKEAKMPQWDGLAVLLNIWMKFFTLGNIFNAIGDVFR